MQEVEAAKTDKQRHQIEAHLLERGQIYLDIWKIGVNTALRISDLLALTMKDIKNLDPHNPAIRLTEQKTGKPRKIVINRRRFVIRVKGTHFPFSGLREHVLAEPFRKTSVILNHLTSYKNHLTY